MSISGLLKSIVLFVGFLVVGLGVAIHWFATADRATDYPVSLDGLVIPGFDQQRIPFVPTFDKTRTLPFAAGAIVDIDNDGIEEVFFGGGVDQQDALYRFEDGGFVDITAASGWTKKTPDKTFSAVSLDLDDDGDNDLLVTRQSGVFLYRNEEATFTEQKLTLEYDAETVSLSVAVGAFKSLRGTLSHRHQYLTIHQECPVIMKYYFYSLVKHSHTISNSECTLWHIKWCKIK